MSRTRDPFVFVCPHCGRVWDATGMGTARRSALATGAPIGANTGFVAAASDAHTSNCERRSPAERRAENARAEARWARSPPRACRVRNDPRHSGLIDREARP